MPKKLISMRVSDRTNNKLSVLSKVLELSKSDIINIAISLLFTMIQDESDIKIIQKIKDSMFK